jgi:tRNA A37 threonylcarbamoyladenosine modification protein TsaB
MTLRLIIDTTLCGASVALVSGEGQDEKIWTGFQTERGDSDSAICRFIDEGLEQLGKKSSEIDSIIVSHGPGSFTGIKVGLAWAYGFQAARKESLLVGLSSLAEGLFALQRKASKKLVVLVPISRREAFLCWEGKNKEVVFSSITLHSDEDLKQIGKASFYLISVDSKTKQWVETFSSEVHEMEMSEFTKLAMTAMVEKVRTLDFTKLRSRMVSPQYLKKTTVEEKLALRG